ncbi:winged helix-turn-helix transcriptional regulator [Streptomyces sp. 3214.6]|uniref:winged helix-turn-helix transcriptional regulator n=1 Tax=Streptomyces sp. 3214.6 TaxID=1882757 RepID=UPI00090B7745|nr:helix-turn-helix domain-containing protein [Streptomyces sp. 3214.6]SHH30015.1 transcriptional regulator, HxlR family [Streptomyces sp. 3214.6]
MRRKSSIEGLPCNIAHALQAIGDEWSWLIVRDVLRGKHRFDEFQKSLPIAPAVLTNRLRSLVEAGILERRRYSAHQSRFSYELTERGRQLEVIIVALDRWGHEHAQAEDELPLLAFPSQQARDVARDWFAA